MNIKACAKTLEASAHTRSACCQLPTSWQPAPHLLGSLLSVTWCLRPCPHSPTTPHSLPSSALPSVKGAATELFPQWGRGCGGIHVLLCPVHPLELWTQARGGLGSGMLTWGALRQGLAAAILTQGWQRHNCLEGDSQATGLLPTSSPGTEQVPVLRLQSFLGPLSAIRSRAGGRESGCLWGPALILWVAPDQGRVTLNGKSKTPWQVMKATRKERKNCI